MKETFGRASLNGLLTAADEKNIRDMKALYSQYAASPSPGTWREINSALLAIISKERRIHLYPYGIETERIVAKVRNERTPDKEFAYYVQRAYELLFRFSFLDGCAKKRDEMVTTPVGIACHTFPAVDDCLRDTVICVMLRGALLPSMVISKEIEDYTSGSFVPPFALFRVKRDETRKESDMLYVLDLDRSYFNLKELNNKDLVFADPMNATGGSFLAILNYLGRINVTPRKIKFLNLIASLQGPLTVIRSCRNVDVYTLWMDPCLNDNAYILPGLGDAGDRLNGTDKPGQERDILQLVADYGTDIVTIYRSQVREIEKTVLA